MKRGHIFCLYKGQFFKIEIWVLCYLPDWASSYKGSINLFWFHVGRRSRILPYVLIHSNITWPASELCYFIMRIIPLGKRGRVAEETQPEVANVQNLLVLIFSNWNKITFPC